MKPSTRRATILIIAVLLATLAPAAGWLAVGRHAPAPRPAAYQAALGKLAAPTGKPESQQPLAPVAAQPKFDGRQTYEHVRSLTALGPRIQGSAGEAAAAEYLRRAFTEYGYTVELQPFAIPGGGTGHNVVARDKTSDQPRWLAIGGHYDTVAGTVGANDNGSGTAVVLELARVMKGADLPYSLRFVLFSAEEDQNPPRVSYSGSMAYVASLSPADRRAGLGYINIDMVGWPGAIYSVGNLRLADQGLYNLTTQVAAARGVPMVFNTGYSVRKSDHQSFEKAGIPTVSLGAADYPYHHKPSDDMTKISPERLEVIGQLIVNVLRAQADRLGYN